MNFLISIDLCLFVEFHSDFVHYNHHWGFDYVIDLVVLVDLGLNRNSIHYNENEFILYFDHVIEKSFQQVEMEMLMFLMGRSFSNK